ncbi:DnaJ-like protein subfamily C member 7 [Bienertia sinuspersici]
MNSSKSVNLKVASKVDKAGNALIDEIRKLRIENQNIGSQSSSNVYERGSANLSGIQEPSKGVNSDLPSDLSGKIKKLNLGVSGSESKVSGVTFDNVGGSHGVHNVDSSFRTSLASELPIGMEKLNLKDPAEVGNQNFSFGGGINSFMFGSSRTVQDSSNPTIASTHPNRNNSMNMAVSDSFTQKEKNVNKKDKTNASRDGGRTKPNVVVDTMVLDDFEKLRIRDASKKSSEHAVTSDSSPVRHVPTVSMTKEENKTLHPQEFINPIRQQHEHSIGPQVAEHESNKNSGFRDASASSTSSFPSAGFSFQSVRHEFEVPCTDGAEKKEGFVFSGKQEGIRIPPVEFRAPDSKGSLFTSPNLSTRRGLVKDAKSKGRKAQIKEPKSVLISPGKNFIPKENIIRDESSDSYSPMDVSPYREGGNDEQSGGESLLSPENQTSIDSQAAHSYDATDEDLIRAVEYMDINEGNDENNDEAEEHECTDNKGAATGTSPVDCVSAVESESFMSACENLDENGENEVESNSEEQSYDQTRYFSASSSASSGDSSFTFAASSSAQSQVSATMRYFKKKNRAKTGPDLFIPSRSAVLSDAATSLQFSPIPRVSVLPSQVVQSDGVPTAPLKGSTKITSPTTPVAGDNNVGDTKRFPSSPTVPARAAQEACEKWRLRGNQAYTNGDLEKAEEYYSQGLKCIPQHETSRDCLRALVLCYSNRAAARMSCGRMREALRDCLVAAEIDPNFFRVQLRAANCYLALGEIGDALQHFKKLLQSTDVCVERKIILEASDGLQKAQKASDFMDRAAGLLLQRTIADAESALEVIAEALVVSPHSEKLLESKAEALFMLRRYEEVIQLCGQTLEPAEKNSVLLGADDQSSYLEASELLKCYSFRIWRYCLLFKSNFYLGKLEEAVDFLEKQECWRSMVAKFGKEIESFIPHLSIARELITHKSAGNGAFQAGKHKEAVEHYTAALSLNVESRPFSAVCFANRAAAYQALGRITDAIADCSLAIALDEHYVKAISRRATLFEMIRDYDQAAKDLEKLVFLLTKQAEEKSNHAGAYLPMSSVADLRQARQRLYQMEEQAKKEIPLNLYLILGMEPSATAADLKKAYRKAALRHHPDKAGQSLARTESGDDDLWKEIAEGVYKDADKLFKMIGEAYAVLSDPDKVTDPCMISKKKHGMAKGKAVAMHQECTRITLQKEVVLGDNGERCGDLPQTLILEDSSQLDLVVDISDSGQSNHNI